MATISKALPHHQKILQNSCNTITDQDISPTLKKVRFALLHFNGVTRFISIDQSLLIREIINDYIGPDKSQEADVARTFTSIQNDKRADELFNKSILSEVQNINNNLIIGVKDNNTLNKCIYIFKKTLKNLIESNSFIGDLSILETSIDERMYAILLSSIITKAENFIISDFPQEWKENIAFFRQFLRTNYIFSMAQLSAETGFALSKNDRSHLDEWIKRVVALQQHATAFINPLTLKGGYSQGITFSIKNKEDNRVYGYLHGTAHTDINQANQISMSTQKRLLQCALLGTEINQSISRPYGVEKTLTLLAHRNEIALIGIDDRRLPDGRIKVTTPDILGAVKFMLYEWMLCHAYYIGDKDKMMMLSKSSETIAPLQNKQYLLIERNHIMTENMDSLMKACDKIARQENVAPIKCFFAVGFQHVTPSYSCNLVELLEKKGWTLEYITPERVPLRHRCRSLTNCLFSFVFTFGRGLLSATAFVVNELRKK